MKQLYVLAGAYDEGTEKILLFYADPSNEDAIAQYIIDNAAQSQYNYVLSSLGYPQNTEEFWKALSYSFVDGDSKMGWVLYKYDEDAIKYVSV